MTTAGSTTESINQLARTLQTVPEPLRTQLVDEVCAVIAGVSQDTWDGYWAANPSPEEALRAATQRSADPSP